MDNCSAQSYELKSSDGSITCMFLPLNTTSLIQPIDQGVLQAAKNCYKRKLLQRVITSQDTETTQSLKEIMKKLTVKDSIYMLADAWEEASAKSINIQQTANSSQHWDMLKQFWNANGKMENSESMMENVNQVGNSEVLSTSGVNDWLRADDELPTSLQLSDEQILASFVGQSSVEDESSDEEDESSDE